MLPWLMPASIWRPAWPGCAGRISTPRRTSSASFTPSSSSWSAPICPAGQPKRICARPSSSRFSNLDQYSGKVPIEHWVSRITINTCLNALKAESLRPELRWSDLNADQAEVLEALATNPGELDPASGAASRDLVETLLGALDAKDRLLITMLHLEGYSMDDIRKTTGWNIATIKVRAFRARQKLKRIFQELNSQGKI